MSATFEIGASIATFGPLINGARHSTQGDLPQLTLGTYFQSSSEWDDLFELLTTSFAVHSPIGGTSVVVDVLRGGGQGILRVDNLGEWDAIMTACERTQFLPNDQSIGSASFLLVGVVV